MNESIDWPDGIRRWQTNGEDQLVEIHKKDLSTGLKNECARIDKTEQYIKKPPLKAAFEHSTLGLMI